MYSAEIMVNGVKGYVGGSNAQDLADGVKACAEAMENALGVCSDEYYADEVEDYEDEDYDNEEYYDEDWYEDALYCLMSIFGN